MLRACSLFLCLTFFGSPARADSVVFLVRHAEKVDDSRDPELTEAGRARARRLAHFLANAEIERVLSTDFIRTRDTARPTAEILGLEVEIYGDLEELAASLGSSDARALVVGHSDTTPDLVARLGGKPGPPMKADEYDRLYIVTVSGASIETIVLRLPDANP